MYFLKGKQHTGLEENTSTGKYAESQEVSMNIDKYMQVDEIWPWGHQLQNFLKSEISKKIAFLSPTNKLPPKIFFLKLKVIFEFFL